VKSTYGLTEAEVARMVEDSYAYAEVDVNARLLIEAQTEADTVMNHVRRALTQGAGLLNPEERARIDAGFRALNEARQGSDRDLIRERTTALNRATERLAEALMDKALKDALASKRAEKILEQK
jgi:molecular chaperone HscA